MKKCDHFKELILTDYIDGELDKNTAGSLESHLLDCGDCRIFLKEVNRYSLFPARRTLRQPVPSELWDTIKQRIEQEEQETGLFVDLIDNLKELFAVPRLVPIFASLTVMFIAGSMTLNTIQIQQAQAKDQGEYLVSLLSSTGTGDNNDVGTPIEHYFL